MANTHDVGKFYWHTMVYPVNPKVIFDRAETQEIEGKYRGGNGWAIRLPFTRLSIVVGVWGKSYEERAALTRAINGRAIEEEAFDWDTVRFGAEYEDL
ncbi:hypothetical protein UFOVP27_121 [uncultured Caudovirales phage]|uniref:Uncharacterized protein n=1 Tax=uncultured Caudovirales phage TaxID=2100421 RepID=A0A6J5KM67_9CAUD|nr:hypothetical protein UFOVP27_121 [uncultured Caudovirales phage]